MLSQRVTCFIIVRRASILSARERRALNAVLSINLSISHQCLSHCTVIVLFCVQLWSLSFSSRKTERHFENTFGLIAFVLKHAWTPGHDGTFWIRQDRSSNTWFLTPDLSGFSWHPLWTGELWTAEWLSWLGKVQYNDAVPIKAATVSTVYIYSFISTVHGSIEHNISNSIMTLPHQNRIDVITYNSLAPSHTAYKHCEAVWTCAVSSWRTWFHPVTAVTVGTSRSSPEHGVLLLISVKWNPRHTFWQTLTQPITVRGGTIWGAAQHDFAISGRLF